jgi:SAM-dependent methyltransferase
MYDTFTVYLTIMLAVSMMILFTFESWKTMGAVSVMLIVLSYLVVLAIDKFTASPLVSLRKEGFEDAAQTSKYEWLQNDDLFDDFYASVFTKLTQTEALLQAEAALCMEEFVKGKKKNQIKILDAGCGIGIATCSFVKQGVGHATGIDKSQAMIRYAKGTTLPSTTLTDIQKQDIEFRTFDLQGPGAAGGAEFTDACLLYFTVYYFQDLDQLFRNLALWVQPDGNLAVEVVNKYKFEPVLNPSNPWVGISPQRYVADRITKSHIVFDKFEYDAVFDLEDPRAEFRETFRFKDGSVRRQKHQLYMPSMPEIIKKAQNNGWTYTKYVDLMPLSFQYGYLLFFKRNA